VDEAQLYQEDSASPWFGFGFNFIGPILCLFFI